MFSKIDIALSVANADKPGRYFSFRLQHLLYNEPAEYSKPSKLFVVSDIEGNFQAFCKLLLKNGVIDKYFNWQFQDGHLVILGDCFDRGEQVTECLWLIYSLEQKARKKGGYVHFILGNHEIMNMNGDWRYVHPKYAVTSLNSKKSPTALYDANSELWRWLHTKNIMEKIGDILFVHAGIATEINEINLSLTEINSLARAYYNRSNEFSTDTLIQLLFNSERSPFWYRGYYQGGVSEEQINATLSKFGVSTIVTGHTVVEHVSSFYNGKVINIDTDHAGGISEGLFIKHSKFYRVDTSPKKEKIK